MNQGNIRNSIGLEGLLFFLAVFFVTLRSFYFYQLSLSPMPLLGIGIFLVLGLARNKSLNRFQFDTLRVLILLVIFLSVWSLIALFSGAEVYINSIVGVFLNLLFFSVLMLNATYLSRYMRLINYILAIHLSFFYFQFFSFYFLGEVVDYIEPITGESQRMVGFSKVEVNGISLFRPAGLFNEPGNFSVYTLSLLWIARVAGVLKGKIEVLAVIAAMLSFSLFGIVVASFYIFVNYYNKIRPSVLFVIGLIVLIFSVYVYDLALAYYEYRVANIGSDSSTQKRLYMFTLFAELPIFVQLFGSGIGNNIIDMHMTTIPSILVGFGIVGGLILTFLMLYLGSIYKVTFKSFSFVALLSFQFYTVSNSYFWLFFGLLFIGSHMNNRMEPIKNEKNIFYQ